MEPLSVAPNLIEQVHARLVDAIADGTLPPRRAAHPGGEVAERLSVSRQPVSHALQLLRRQGLVIDQRQARGLRGGTGRGRAAVSRDLLPGSRCARWPRAPRLAADRVACRRGVRGARSGRCCGITSPRDAPFLEVTP